MALLLCRRFVHAGTLRMIRTANSKRAGGSRSSAGDAISQRRWGARLGHAWPSIPPKSIACKLESGWPRWLFVGCGDTVSASWAVLYVAGCDGVFSLEELLDVLGSAPRESLLPALAKPSSPDSPTSFLIS